MRVKPALLPVITSSALALLGLSLCGVLAGHGRTRASDEPGLAHELLNLSSEHHSAVRVHHFRLPLTHLRAEVVDLGYTVPLGNALGDGDLVVNGGFWGWYKTERRVIGLLASGGRVISPLRAGLDGGVLMLHGERASIVPSRAFREPAGLELAVQCRPRLLQAGKLVPALNAHGRAARTAVCVRESGHTLDVYVTDPADLGPSLAELGGWLATQGCDHALNLDGGPSTAAAFRDNGKLVRIGPGRELPYALRFTYAAQ